MNYALQFFTASLFALLAGGIVGSLTSMVALPAAIFFIAGFLMIAAIVNYVAGK